MKPEILTSAVTPSPSVEGPNNALKWFGVILLLIVCLALIWFFWKTILLGIAFFGVWILTAKILLKAGKSHPLSIGSGFLTATILLIAIHSFSDNDAKKEEEQAEAEVDAVLNARSNERPIVTRTPVQQYMTEVREAETPDGNYEIWYKVTVPAYPRRIIHNTRSYTLLPNGSITFTKGKEYPETYTILPPFNIEQFRIITKKGAADHQNRKEREERK